MNQDYEPEFADGLIIVFFKGTVGRQFAEDFGNILGYELEDEEVDYGGFFYKTPKGKELEACQDFEEQGVVDGAERFDLKSDRRYKQIEELEEMVENLDGVVLDDPGYKKELENIKKYIEKIEPK